MSDSRNESNRGRPNRPTVSIEALLAAANHQPPPLDRDPTARLLGLVPDPANTLDAAALKVARQSARLSVSDLAQRLQDRGWSITTGDVFLWETRSTSDVVPALIAAIAVEVNAPLERLQRKTTSVDSFGTIRSSDRFRQLIERWAQLFSLSPSAAGLALESRALATVHRGEKPDSDQTLQMLEALVDELERKATR